MTMQAHLSGSGKELDRSEKQGIALAERRAPTGGRAAVVTDRRLVGEALVHALSAGGIDATSLRPSEWNVAARLRKWNPDVVLLDSGMSTRPWTAVLVLVRSTRPHSRVLLLSGRSERRAAEEAEAFGADGAISITAALDELAERVRNLAGLADDSPTVEPLRLPETVTPLTRRETQVLRMIASGKSTEEIAEALGIAVVTVRTHVQRILVKLDVHSRLAAVAYAARQGIV